MKEGTILTIDNIHDVDVGDHLSVDIPGTDHGSFMCVTNKLPEEVLDYFIGKYKSGEMKSSIPVLSGYDVFKIEDKNITREGWRCSLSFQDIDEYHITCCEEVQEYVVSNSIESLARSGDSNMYIYHAKGLDNDKATNDYGICISPWIEGTFESRNRQREITWEIKRLDNPDPRGINFGRIIKLIITEYGDDIDARTLASYERGWDLMPDDYKTKLMVEQILNRYN